MSAPDSDDLLAMLDDVRGQISDLAVFVDGDVRDLLRVAKDKLALAQDLIEEDST